MVSRVAIMDLGSNSSRLDLFAVGDDGAFEHVEFSRVPTKLIGYVDDSNVVSDEGICIACESLDELATHAKRLGHVDGFHVFATASLRGRANERVAVARIAEETGFNVEVIPGEQEAAFGFASLQRRFEPTCAVMADVGGGSTEVVVADGGEIISLRSLPLGSRALSERFAEGVWPTAVEVESIRGEVASTLERYRGLGLSGTPVLFGIGGTARALAGIFGDGRPRFDAGLRSTVEGSCPERLDTMAAGVLIFEGLWNAFSPQRFVASDANPREGYLIKRVLGNNG